MEELSNGYYYAKLYMTSFFEVVEVVDNKVYRIGDQEEWDPSDFYYIEEVDFEVPI